MFHNFTAFTSIVSSISPASSQIHDATKQEWNTRTKPPGSLGKLEDIASWVASVQQKSSAPEIKSPTLRLYAGAHGITEEGVSMCPVSVNAQMLKNFHNGGAAINALCRSNHIDFSSIDVGIESPTRNFLKESAMTEAETIQALKAGWDSVPAYSDLFAVGEMGIGNTTPSAAIISTVTQTSVDQITGRGAGLTDELLEKKTQTLITALENRKSELTNPLSILAAIGGKEIAAMTGGILSAAHKNIPVVLDGVIAGAAACIAFELNPHVIGKCIAGHRSEEPAHTTFLKHYKLEPILDLKMRLGEGTGAAVAMGVISNAVDAFNHMATFEQAGVTL